MKICRAKVRTLMENAVENGAGCDEDYRSQGISHSEYVEAIEYAIEGATDRMMALIEQEQNDE